MPKPSEIDAMFTGHILNEDGRVVIRELNAQFRKLAHQINITLDEGREKSLAFTKLQEAKMWAVAGLSHQSPVDR